jgi:hypothetical protein
MARINPSMLKAATAGAIIGAFCGLWSSQSTRAFAEGDAYAQNITTGCASLVCESRTWLRLPVLRRTAGG